MGMNSHELIDADVIRADIGGQEATLDLHAKYPNEIEHTIDRFLVENRDCIDALIIYGVGEGVLRRAVLECLHNHPMVRRVIEKPGSCVVFFER